MIILATEWPNGRKYTRYTNYLLSEVCLNVLPVSKPKEIYRRQTTRTMAT